MKKSDKLSIGVYFVVFLLVVVVLVQTIGLGRSNYFFEVTGDILNKATWLSDKIYDVSRDWLGFGQTYSYSDEVFLFRFRFEVDAESHYADFLVKADDGLRSTWDMVYCSNPNIKGVMKPILNNLVIELRNAKENYSVMIQKAANLLWDNETAQGSHSYDVTKWSVDDPFTYVPLTYQSYVVNIRLRSDISYYDFGNGNVIRDLGA